MAKTKRNGNGRLEEALVTLIQNQATLVQNQASFLAQKAETDRLFLAQKTETAKRLAETDQRMAELDREMVELQRQMVETNRINSERFARLEAILLEHNRILEKLPDAIRERSASRRRDS